MGHGGRIGRPENGGRLAPVSRRAEPPVQLRQVGGGGRASSLQVTELRRGQGARQPPRGRFHRRHLARRVATQRIEPPRERDHGPGALLELRSRQTKLFPLSSSSRARAARSSGSPAAPAAENGERRLTPSGNPAPLVRDGDRGREPPEPAAPDEQSRGRQEHEHRGQADRRRSRSTATSATTQSTPRARSSALAASTRPRSATTATVLTPTARPPPGGGERRSPPTRPASVARRRTRPRRGPRRGDVG